MRQSALGNAASPSKRGVPQFSGREAAQWRDTRTGVDGSRQGQAASPGEGLAPRKASCLHCSDGRFANAARWRQQDERQGFAAGSFRHVPIPIEVVPAEGLAVAGALIPPNDGRIDLTSMIEVARLVRHAEPDGEPRACRKFKAAPSEVEWSTGGGYKGEDRACARLRP